MFIKKTTNNLDLKNLNMLFKHTKSENNIPIKNFSDYIKSSLDQMSYEQNLIEHNIKKFQMNQPNNSLSDIIIDLQKSSLALQFTIQIRNKLVSGYQEIMNMQI